MALFLKRSIFVILTHLFLFGTTQDITIIGISSPSSDITPVAPPSFASTSSNIPIIGVSSTTPEIIITATSSPIPTSVSETSLPSSSSTNWEPRLSTTTPPPSSTPPASFTPPPSTVSPPPPASPSAPPLVDGDSAYQLKGCYNELPNYTTERALGLTGQYITPVIASPDALTVPLCLEACALALAPDNVHYTYAAVENTRECYCGLTLSKDSTTVDPASCSSACVADPTTSCGGPGFLVLYQLRSSIDNTSSTTSAEPTTTPTTSPSPVPKSTKSSNTTGMWIGIGCGLAALALVVGLLLWWQQRRYNTRRRLRAMQQEMATGTGTFIGDHELEQEQEERGLGTNDGRRSGFVGEAQFFQSPPHEIQSEESGQNRRNAFAAWKMKKAAANETGIVNSPAKIAAAVLPIETSKVERRKTFEAWKSGVVRPLSGNTTDMGGPVLERDSVGESKSGAAELPDPTSNKFEGHGIVEATAEKEEHKLSGEMARGGNGEELSIADPGNSTNRVDEVAEISDLNFHRN